MVRAFRMQHLHGTGRCEVLNFRRSTVSGGRPYEGRSCLRGAFDVLPEQPAAAHQCYAGIKMMRAAPQEIELAGGGGKIGRLVQERFIERQRLVAADDDGTGRQARDRFGLGARQQQGSAGAIAAGGLCFHSPFVDEG